jgi:hypothetical protein
LFVEEGILYLVNNGTAAANSFMYAIPARAHNLPDLDGTISSIITPKIATAGANSYHRAYVSSCQELGDYPLNIAAEPYVIYMRTSGIDDNTGTWHQLPNNRMDLSGVDGAEYIQFKFEFKVVGLTSCLPNRIYSLAIAYDKDDVLPSVFRWNLSDSSDLNGTVGFTQSATADALSVIIISYYRVDNGSLLLTQDSASTTNGTFEYYDTNTSSWVAGVGPNTANTRRRFVPSYGLPAGVSTYPKISIG